MVLRMMDLSGREHGGDNTPNRASIKIGLFGLRETSRRIGKTE